MTTSSNTAIASRIRGLIAGEDDLPALAARLRVDELALRISIDELSAYPTIDVITAVIREYGVDPSWLLTGVYDVAAHRETLTAASNELRLKVAEIARKHGTDTPTQLRIVREP